MINFLSSFYNNAILAIDYPFRYYKTPFSYYYNLNNLPMKTILEYDIIAADNLKGLVEATDELIKEGWQPYYGLVISTEELDHRKQEWFYQAIVRYE